MRILSNGLIGIGKSNPSGALNLIVGGNNAAGILTQDTTANGQNSLEIRLRNVNTSANYIVCTERTDVTNDSLAATTRFIVKQSGNVGIGLATPSSLLHVNGGLVATQMTGTTIYASSQHLGATADTVSAPSYSWEGDTNCGMFHADTDTIGFTTAGVERMRITTGGNLGIGITAPSALLHIGGGLVATQMTGTTIYASSQHLGATSDTATVPSYSWEGDTNCGMFHASTDTIGFTTNGSEKMRIATGGHVLIGTQTLITSSLPMLSVTTTSGNSYISIQGTSGSQKAIEFYDTTNSKQNWAIYNPGTSSDLRFYSANATSDKIFFSSNGNVGIGKSSSLYQLELSTDSAGKPTTSTWIISSDRRVKNNIVDADLDICYYNIVNVPLRRYGYNTKIKEYEEYKIGDINVVGFIADEFKQYFPKAVSVSTTRLTVPKDFYFEDMTGIIEETAYIQTTINDMIEDPDNKILVVPDFKGLNTSQIIPCLVGAFKKQVQVIQEQQQKINTLETQLSQIQEILARNNIV